MAFKFSKTPAICPKCGGFTKCSPQLVYFCRRCDKEYLAESQFLLFNQNIYTFFGFWANWELDFFKSNLKSTKDWSLFKGRYFYSSWEMGYRKGILVAETFEDLIIKINLDKS